LNGYLSFGAVALLRVVFAPSAARGSTLSAFHTPNWTIQCIVEDDEGPPILTCETIRRVIASMTGSYIALDSASETEARELRDALDTLLDDPE
jgi:hypothetical protein